MSIQILGPIRHAETIATGRSIRDLARLVKLYGKGRWRKRKGIANIVTPTGARRRAEIHWYEADGIGPKEFKVKRYVS